MRYILQCESEAAKNAVIKDVQNSGGSVVRHFENFPSHVVVEDDGTDAYSQWIATTPGILSFCEDCDNAVEIPTLQETPLPENYERAWGVNHMQAKEVHAKGITGKGVKVAVLDTGSFQHNDLKLAGEYNAITPGTPATDGHGHSTHVRGTVSAQVNAVGVAGMAPDAEVYAVKVLTDQGGGSWSDIGSAVDWCITNGMDVISLSLGGSGNPGSVVENFFIEAERRGIVIVASAGNSGGGPGQDKVGYPAKFDSVIAVAATANPSNDRATYSSTGPAVEVAAPGSNIESTYITDPDSTAVFSGTSMACPHVSGTVALMLEAGIPNIREALQRATFEGGPRDDLKGFGTVNALKAVEGESSPVFKRAVIADASASTGNPVKFSFEWGDNSTSLSSTPVVEHKYLADGVYTVTVSITNEKGEVAAESKEIEVKEAPVDEPLVVKFEVRNKE